MFGGNQRDMAQADVGIHVLVVGAMDALATGIREALSQADLQQVRHAVDDVTAVSLARELHPTLVILDFAIRGSDSLADQLSSLTPRSWVVDFSGALRRRPEHSGIRLEQTVPLVLSPTRFG